MPVLKLDYFDIHGGRGETARLIMALGEIPFEDDRIPMSEWPSRRDSMPLKGVPVLHVDGDAVTQSNSINRYLGRIADLYPDDEYDALRCDEIMDAVEDVVTAVVVTMRMQDEAEKKAAREALVDGPIATYLGYLEERLAEGGEFFIDNRLTIADLKVFVWVRGLRKGILDHIPSDLVEKKAPLIAEHCDRLAQHPGIVAWYKSH